MLLVILYFLFYLSLCWCFFFFKQKTAYELRISDWSSDVCSSDLSSLWKLQPQRPLMRMVAPPLDHSWMWSTWGRCGISSQVGCQHVRFSSCNARRSAPRKNRRCAPTSITRDLPSKTMRSTSAPVSHLAAAPGVSLVRFQSSL